jgi:hypothetical protein
MKTHPRIESPHAAAEENPLSIAGYRWSCGCASECSSCGHTEDETYNFDLPFAGSQAMEADEPGECPEYGAPVQMHLKRTQQRQ